MNFASIEDLWSSPANRLSGPDQEKLKMNCVNEVKRRRRQTLRFLIGTGVLLAGFTARLAWHFVSPAPGTNLIDFGREWASVAIFALPWIGWTVLVVRHVRQRTAFPNYDRSIADSVRAMCDENREEQARYKVVMAMQLALLVALPVVVLQLRAVGKAGDEILVPGLVVAPVVVLGIMAGNTWRYFKTLRPRQRELESLLEAYAK